MKIIVAGLNHKNTPIEIREKLAFDPAQTTEALEQLKTRFPEFEFVILSTCNRVEIYCACNSSPQAGSQQLAQFLSEFHNVPLTDFQDFLYVLDGCDAVRHLLTVAPGLDSMVVGEPQILGQVKESYRLASAANCTGKILSRLFHCAFATAKKIHTTTSISAGRISAAGVAVELAAGLFTDVASAGVVVIGAGDMGQLLIKHLLHIGCRDITIVNRSFERGLNVACRYKINSGKWENLAQKLIGADIVIASAATDDYLFDKRSVRELTEKRTKGNLLIIDIAVPRNFAPSVNELGNVHLYSIDDLSQIAERNRRARKDDIDEGMHIICKSVENFTDWFGARDIGPMIGQMKEKFTRIAQNELDTFFACPSRQTLPKVQAELMIKRIVNKLVHRVVKNVEVVTKEHGASEAAKLVSSILSQTEALSAEPDDKGDVQL